MSVFERPELSLITSRMIAASVADSPEENDIHPLHGRIVVIKKQCLEPLDLEFYEHKGLLQRWAEGIRPSIRIGTVHTKKSILVEYLTDPESARQLPSTGAMVVECSYLRGLAARTKARELYRISPQDSRSLTELFLEAAQSADEFPLARSKPGVAQELQAVGGGQLPETKVTQSSQNPKAKGEALAKKQAKRQKQKAAKTDDQNADDFARKQCRELTSYLRIASASYIRCPEEYYDSYAGIWTPPPLGHDPTRIHFPWGRLWTTCTRPDHWRRNRGACRTHQE